ncbi:MAG: PilZ domain-containing protein [Sedimentisphaerales bacterium]|nr:PilZ domain-containing protein [Sedimentisphaerales bacterium]
MATAFVITTGMNAIFMALTPIERWHAARRLENASGDQRLFIIMCVVAIIILTVLFIVTGYMHKAKEHNIVNKVFDIYAQRMGLSRLERQILLDIADRTKLKRIESIFTMVTAFENGAAELTKDALARRGAKASKNLSARLSVLREKLGFENKRPTSSATSNKPSSKQIPTGKQLYMTRLNAGESKEIESVVIENNDVELTVKLQTSLESKPGEIWSVRYYFGVSVWEFETSSISCYGNILILNHSSNIRFINRRRFLRVPVNKPTFIARFPFTRTLQPNSDSGGRTANISENSWGPPEFVPASVTEMAGPGLRVEAPLDVKVGDRVLVILKLSEEEQQKPNSQRTGKTAPEKIVEDIGEVRHTQKIKDGFSIAVELTGLSDPNINELVRVTNAASLKTRAKTITDQTFVETNETEPERPEPAVLQGV